MSVFRVEKNKGYTVMSNHHLRNHALSLKAKGLLSQMLSLPEDWDYTLQGLAQINKESIDAIREAVRELERAGYIERSRERDERGCLRGTVYTIYEQPHTEPTSEEPAQEAPKAEKHMHHEPRVNISSHGAKVALVVVGMIVCFLVGMAAGWGLSNSGKMVQLTIGQSASQSDETADKTEESAKENVAVMKWGMNVRSEPTTKTEKNIVAALKKGDTITILSKADDDGWIKISSTDEDGNVISGYMQSVYDGETVYTMK